MDCFVFRWATFATLLAFACAPGCGTGATGRADVEGNVTLDGAALESGSILFVPAAGTEGVVTGGPITGGRYRLAANAAAAVGRNRVEIRSPKSTGKTIQYAPDTAVEPEVVEMVAPRFNAESTIIVEVEQGTNTFDFEVQSK